jgi:hypothetical protein
VPAHGSELSASVAQLSVKALPARLQQHVPLGERLDSASASDVDWSLKHWRGSISVTVVPAAKIGGTEPPWSTSRQLDKAKGKVELVAPLELAYLIWTHVKR